MNDPSPSHVQGQRSTELSMAMAGKGSATEPLWKKAIVRQEKWDSKVSVCMYVCMYVCLNDTVCYHLGGLFGYHLLDAPTAFSSNWCPLGHLSNARIHRNGTVSLNL